MTKHPPAAEQAVGLLLAAGFGRRYDPSGQRDKLMHVLADGHSVLWHSANALKAALPHCIAVVQPAQAEREALLLKLGFDVVQAPQAALGMGASMAAGVQAIQHQYVDAKAMVLALADMAWVGSQAIEQVANATLTLPGGQSAFCAPVYKGQRGHPVGFGSDWFGALASLNGDQGAKQLMKHARCHAIDWPDDGVVKDLDEPLDAPKTAE